MSKKRKKNKEIRLGKKISKKDKQKEMKRLNLKH